jgi:TetR/AcrR family transcriptional repressor of nem operon
MRYDTEHKEKTRQRVLSEAAVVLREAGPERLGVADIMSRAGLTHGGFYAHFKSKDELVQAAMVQAFEDARALFRRCTEAVPPEQGLVNYINAYLARRHRDGRGTGCPVAALSGDLARLPEGARMAFSEGASELIERLSRHLKAMGRPDAATLASSVAAEMIGALTMSRAFAPGAASDAILAKSRAALLARLGLRQAAR